MKEIVLVNYALVGLLRKTLNKHIYDNDQHMEGVIKNFKRQPERKLDGSDLALYIHSRWKDSKASLQTFVVDLEKMNGIITRRKENGTEALADDAKENAAFTTKDAVWSAGKTGPKAELEFQRDLKDIFVKEIGKMDYNRRY